MLFAILKLCVTLAGVYIQSIVVSNKINEKYIADCFATCSVLKWPQRECRVDDQVLFIGQKLHTVKPVYNDHLYNKIYYPWFIQ